MLYFIRLRGRTLSTHLKVSAVQISFASTASVDAASSTSFLPSSLMSDSMYPVVRVAEKYYRRLTEWIWSSGPLVFVLEANASGGRVAIGTTGAAENAKPARVTPSSADIAQ